MILSASVSVFDGWLVGLVEWVTGWLGSSEVLKVVDEVGKLAALVDLLTGGHHALGEGARPAREHTDLWNLKPIQMTTSFIEK